MLFFFTKCMLYQKNFRNERNEPRMNRNFGILAEQRSFKNNLDKPAPLLKIYVSRYYVPHPWSN